MIREKSEEKKREYQPRPFSEEILSSWEGNPSKELFLSISETDQFYSQEGSANFEIIFRSQTQEHGFNYPFQIGTNGNDPNLAESGSLPVLPGDLVILGTDGLFDNLYCISILNTLEKQREQSGGNLNAFEIARALAERAFDLSLENNYFSPFCMGAILNAGLLYKGGKSDDITVSVGIVS